MSGEKSGVASQGMPRQLADLRGSSMVDLADAGVKTANAAKPRCKSYLAHGQRRFVNQLLGKVQTSGLGDSHRGGAQMPQEQAPQVTRPNSEAFAQNIDSAVIEAIFANKTQRSGDSVSGAGPRGPAGPLRG